VVEVVGTPPPGGLSAEESLTDTVTEGPPAETPPGAEPTQPQVQGIPQAENVLITGSSLLNYTFENIQGEATGQVQDIVLDVATGQVLFLIISYGGFLDLGATELPVPLSAFAWQPGNQLVLTVEEARLENFPQLDQNWPDASVPGWEDQLATFWGGLGFEPHFRYDAPTNTVLRASDVIGYPVGNVGLPDAATQTATDPAVATPATVEDLLIDLGQGRATYLVVSFTPGGLPDEAIAVPFEAFDPAVFGDQFVFDANINAETLQAAPRFNRALYTGADPVDPTAADVHALFWRGIGYGDEAAAPAAEVASIDLTAAGGVANAPDILVRATALLDDNFQTIDGAPGGGIADMLIDVSDGRILFVTLEYGGLLGLGAAALPVPLSAFTWDPAGELRLIVTEEQLQNFPNVGADWPDLTNPAWDNEVTVFWRDLGIDPGFDVTEASHTILWASDLLNYQAVEMGSGPGTIVDLLVALAENRAKYIILAQGAGTADSPRVAVPFSAIDDMAFGQEFVFDSGLDPAVLLSAPRFDPTLYTEPGPLDATLLADIDAYWEHHGYPVQVR
jgi:hypothetical protein